MESSWEEKTGKKSYGRLIVVALTLLVGSFFLVNNFLPKREKPVKSLPVKDFSSVRKKNKSVKADTDTISNIGKRNFQGSVVSIPNIKCFNKELNSDIELSVKLFSSDTSILREMLLYRDEVSILSNKLLNDRRVENIKTDKLQTDLKDEINALQKKFRVDSVLVVSIRPVSKG